MCAALSVAVVAACTGDADRSSSSTPTTTPPPVTTSTTPARPELRAQLDDPLVPVVVLPSAPFEGAPKVVGSDGPNLVAFGGVTRDETGMGYRPTDEGAVLDGATMSWSRLPEPPFEDPTFDPVGVVADGQLLVSGQACVGYEPVTTTSATCRPDELQTARLDLSALTWERLPSPKGRSGTRMVRMWATPSGVLAMTSTNQVQPGSDDSVWSFMATGAHRWTLVDPPPIPITMVCGFESTVAVASTEHSSDGRDWAVGGSGFDTQSDRYRNARAVFWDDEAGEWGRPTDEVVQQPIDLVGGACIREGLVWMAMADPWRAARDETLEPTDQGLYVARPGEVGWERRPFQPPAGVGLAPFPEDPVPSMADPTSVVLLSFVWETPRVLDVDTGTWRTWVGPEVRSENLTDASLLGHPIIWDRNAGTLVAIRHD